MTTPVDFQTIPLTRVQELVKSLLGIDDLSRVRSLDVHTDSVIAEVYAVDVTGSYYLRDGEVAVDSINIRVDQES
jgi:hypothetical protein